MKTFVNAEVPKIKKRAASLLNSRYHHPKTSLLIFGFDSHPFASSLKKWKNAQMQKIQIEDKDVYLFDDFFTSSESKDLREYSQTAHFSRSSYGSPESIEKGEKPARSMNNKERWLFFSKPPLAVEEVFKLLSLFAHVTNTEITTLPWELCDEKTGSPAVIANFLEGLSPESMQLGKHQDSNSSEGIPFGIPVLYSEGEFHPHQFNNGDVGKPWLVSLMLYAAAENYKTEYAMGTVFYDQRGNMALHSDCLHTRMVFFEGDIWHSIEQSKIPSDVKTWRVSYVFKLIFNPKDPQQSPKKAFQEWIQKKDSLQESNENSR